VSAARIFSVVAMPVASVLVAAACDTALVDPLSVLAAAPQLARKSTQKHISRTKVMRMGEELL
jgi:hypothetical protein